MITLKVCIRILSLFFLGQRGSGNEETRPEEQQAERLLLENRTHPGRGVHSPQTTTPPPLTKCGRVSPFRRTGAERPPRSGEVTVYVLPQNWTYGGDKVRTRQLHRKQMASV